MMYRRLEGFSGSLPCFFNYYGSFPRVSGVCSIFLPPVGDRGKIIVYVALCSVHGTTSSCYYMAIVSPSVVLFVLTTDGCIIIL
jgi:hypothetical protein